MKACRGLPTAAARFLAAAALVVAATAGCAGSAGNAGTQSRNGSTSPAPTLAPTSPRPGLTSTSSTSATPRAPSPTASTPRSAAPTPPTATAPPIGQETLRPGDSGPAVLALQRQLGSLGYWVATPDGTYGELTAQAVVAVQKAAGLSRDGVYGPRTAAALARATRPTAHSGSGHVIEIDLARQLLLLVTNGHVDTVLDTSTGSGAAYTVSGETHIAVTPTGSYRIFRQVDGSDRSPLGVLWRPKYFNGGIAIHGYPDVPPYPASHGCVRVSNAAINWIWASDLAPIGTSVLVY
ncbi:MAG TPA: L,D-transpeptidase family protein [Actinocrinis sp.]|nr:L,D-transpeptidase family protein [Actinocrinis sp.]